MLRAVSDVVFSFMYLVKIPIISVHKCVRCMRVKVSDLMRGFEEIEIRRDKTNPHVVMYVTLISSNPFP